MRTSPYACRSSVSLFVLTTLFLACSGESTGPDIGPPAAVVVTPAQATIGALGGTTTLAATLTDANGNAIANASYTWSSSSEAVATVSAAGVVTAVANGNVTITATAQGISGSAAVTVQQTAATVAAAPDSVRLFVGRSAQLTVTVRDANGNPVAGATVTWSSANTAIATVNASGVVTGAGAGTTSVTATSGGRTGTATVVVAPRPPNLVPARDTTLSGTVNAGAVVIPAGVTVNVQGTLTLNAVDSARIAGNVTGDCTALTIDAAGDVTVLGRISNVCTAEGPAPQTLRIVAGGAIRLLGADLSSSRGVSITNAPNAEALTAPRLPGDVASTLAGMRTSHNCVLSNVLVRSVEGASGADGSPAGADGASPGPHTITCGGDFIVRGPDNSGIFGNHGGRGGTGSSTVSGTAGQGGKGGKGADIIVVAAGNVEIETFLLLVGGRGGAGGSGFAEAHPTAIANGGDAGASGLPRIRLGGTFRGSGEISMDVGSAGRGGGGSATGSRGKDATASEPAEPGGDATARGGNASDYGGPGVINLIGDLVQGNAAGANIRLAATALFPFGGFASVTGGRGGNGSYEFPAGGRGGNMTAQGGRGASVLVVDNRTGARFLDVDPVFGGSVTFGGGPGGRGGNGCRKVPFKAGGTGGRGGDAVGSPGDGGTKGGNQADAGTVTFLQETGDGGVGGPGSGPGLGGAAGSDALVLVKKDLVDNNPNFQKGADANPCRIDFSSSVSVQSDANGHEPFIQATQIGGFTIEGTSPGMVTIRSVDPRWVPVMGTIDQDGNFMTSGTGIVAGFSDVPVTFNGTLQKDGDGNITGVTGTLTMDATNSVLPPDGSGNRNPAVYTVNGFSPSFQ